VFSLFSFWMRIRSMFRSVKKSCIHIVHPDGRLIPFDTFNLFYRDQLETERLIPLRRDREQTTHAG
jgi:uncharacterized radical SAM superfamily Fe-S cluster-containing enzyme